MTKEATFNATDTATLDATRISALDFLYEKLDEIMKNPHHTTPAINAVCVALLEESRRLGSDCHQNALHAVAAQWALLRSVRAN